MDVTEERLRTLRELGLSEYGSRAYLALLELGPSEARAISRLARVPIAKVYSTLDQLAHRGFAVILPVMPRRYAPEPIAKVMIRIEAEHAEQARKARERASELDALFDIPARAHASDLGTTTVHRGRRTTTERIESLAQDAKDVLLVASDAFERRDGGTLGGLDGKVRRMRPRSTEGDRAARAFRVDHDAPNPVTIAVFDDTVALLAHHVPDDARRYDGHDVMILVEERAIVRTLRDLLEALWNAAPPETA